MGHLKRRRGVTVLVLLVAMAASPIAPAMAEGPGYGGSAAGLDVRWEAPGTSSGALRAVVLSNGGSARSAGARMPTGDQPRIQQDVLDLTVRGLGFRAKSAVTVRLGGGDSVVVRADTAGSLAVAIDSAQLEGTDPGVSVMAVGRNPSGTQVVLLGSVPPTPGGTGPMSLVPWAALAAAMAGLALWTRRPGRLEVIGRHEAR